jgi:hypothetical protein
LSKVSGEHLSIPVEDSMGESHQERRFSTRWYVSRRTYSFQRFTGKMVILADDAILLAEVF